MQETNESTDFIAGREYYFREGCYILEIWNCPEDPDLSVARARVPPGGTTRWHALDVTCERYLILSGEGIAEVAGDATPVSAGSMIFIPAGQPQRIRNTGKDDLIFHAICTPRFQLQNYRDLES